MWGGRGGGGFQFCKAIHQSMIHEVAIRAHISYQEYAMWSFELIICANKTTSRAWDYIWICIRSIHGLVKKGGLAVLFLFNKSLLNSVGPYKSASQNLSLNFESPKLICQFKTLRVWLLSKFEPGVSICPAKLEAGSSFFWGSGEGDTLLAGCYVVGGVEG